MSEIEQLVDRIKTLESLVFSLVATNLVLLPPASQDDVNSIMQSYMDKTGSYPEEMH